MKKNIKTAAKFMLFLIILIIVLLGGIIGYASITNYRPSERIVLETNKSSDIISDTAEIKLLIWNIGYCGLNAEMDFFYDGGKNTRPSKQQVIANFDQVKSFLTNTNNFYDFVLLQEVDFKSKRSYYINQSDTLLSVLPAYKQYEGVNYKVFMVPVPTFKPYGKVFSGIVTLSKFVPREACRYQFPSKDRWPVDLFSLDRCFVACYYLLQNGKELVIVNTHNSAYDDGSMRRDEMNYFKKFLENEYRKGNYVIVGGDWNQCPPGFNPDFEFHNMDNETRLNIDSEYLPADWTWLYQNKVPTNRRVAKPYKKGETLTTVIDFYLLSPNIMAISTKCIDLDFANSDHHPVVATIKLKP